MKLHGNAALSWRGRRLLAERVVGEGWTLACEDSIEVAAELAVAVADQETKRRSPLLERSGELAGLLNNPVAGRVSRCARPSATNRVNAPHTTS